MKDGEKFISKHMEFEFVNDIIICRFLTKEITLELAKLGIQKRLELTKGEDYKVEVSVAKITSAPKKVRDYLSSPEAKQGINDITKEEFPAKVFSTEEKGVNWLKKLKV